MEYLRIDLQYSSFLTLKFNAEYVSFLYSVRTQILVLVCFGIIILICNSFIKVLSRDFLEYFGKHGAFSYNVVFIFICIFKIVSIYSTGKGLGIVLEKD